MPAYKSYCWSLGTTSFRMVEFNRKIEEQLKLLNEFGLFPKIEIKIGVQITPFKLLITNLLRNKVLLKIKTLLEKIRTQEKKRQV